MDTRAYRVGKSRFRAVNTRNSLLLYYYVLIIVLFSLQTTETYSCPTLCRRHTESEQTRTGVPTSNKRPGVKAPPRRWMKTLGGLCVTLMHILNLTRLGAQRGTPINCMPLGHTALTQVTAVLTWDLKLNGHKTAQQGHEEGPRALAGQGFWPPAVLCYHQSR